MTQDANNQEWWEEEFYQEVKVLENDLGPWNAHKFGEKDGYEYSTFIMPNWAGIKDFVRKVSQQSPEEAVANLYLSLHSKS